MNKSEDNKKYFVALSSNPMIGAKTILKLDKFFGGLEKLWIKANLDKLAKLHISSKIFNGIREVIYRVDPDREMEKLKRLGIKVLTIHDCKYPSLLKEIPDSPALLYVKGDIDVLSDPAIAVVGSRKYSSYGKRIVHEFVHNLVGSGLVITSGLALGIDSLAHQACLEAGGKTIGVLACGLDMIYPSSNKSLAEGVLKRGGAIISEYPPGMVALKYNFPLRNRIIAGMTMGTLIVEAAKQSGTLLTAKAALDYNRELFVIPGSIYSLTSEGANSLIKYGANLITNYEDIISILNLEDKKEIAKAKKIIPDNRYEAVVLTNLCKDNPCHVDKLVKLTALTISELNSTLILMEMKGKVKNLGNNLYVLG